MASRLGVEEGSIPTHEDGRYQHYDNIDSLMHAIRSSDQRTGSQKKNRSAASASRQSKDPMAALYPNYFPAFSGAMSAHATPAAKPRADIIGQGLGTVNKSIFDSSSPDEFDQPDLGMALTSPPPPSSNRRDSFDTPIFSPQASNTGLNKTLFSEGIHTPYPKTPQPLPPQPVEESHTAPPICHFQIGVLSSPSYREQYVYNRVKVSPVDKNAAGTIYQQKDTEFETLWSLRREEKEEAHDFELPTPPSATPGRMTQNELPPMSVDTSRLMKDIATPRTGATESMGDSFFVDDMSPMPLSMSLTPGLPSLSTKRKAAPSLPPSTAKRVKED